MCSKKCAESEPIFPSNPRSPLPAARASGEAPSQAGRAPGPRAPSSGSLQRAAPPRAPSRVPVAAAEAGRGGAARRHAAGWESGQVTPGRLRPFSSMVCGQGSRGRCEGSAFAPPLAASPLLARPGAPSAPLLAGGESGAPAGRGQGLTFPGRRGRRDGGGEERTPGPGDRGRPSGRNLGAARRSGIESGRLGSPARPCLDSGGGASEVAAATPGSAKVKALPAGGAGPREASPAPSWEPLQHPQHRTGRWSPPSLGFRPSPSFPWGLGPAVPGEEDKGACWWDGEERDLLDLDRRGHFPAPGSGAPRRSLPLPPRAEPLSFCFFPLWGAFVSSGQN